MPEFITPAQLERLLAVEPDLPDRTEAEDTSPFLNLLYSVERQQMSESFSEHHFEPGQIVFRENEPGDTMYIVLSGRFIILKGDLEAPIIIGSRGVGEIVGEMALLDNQPRSATIVALQPLRLLGINRQRFRRLLESRPSLSLRIMETLSGRLRRSDEVRSLGQRSERHLISQVSLLQSEKQRLEELQCLRQETSDLIIHDLRNPLGAISVCLKMLTVMLPEECLAPVGELIDVAQVSSERMRRLVDSILEVSRMESGEARFNLSAIDLPEMLSEIVKNQAVVNRRGIQIHPCLPPDLPGLHADADKIERVIANLLDNAIKYTPDNGLVELAAAVHDQQFQISVTDSGPGIPPEQRQRIFERFAQVDGEHRRRSGFGLGLAYCRLAVERHGGRIWVEDGPGGVGSRFVFTLPVTPLNRNSTF